MIELKISKLKSQKQFLNIEICVPCNNESTILYTIPNWRPGRYETQNYAKNIRNFNVTNPQNQLLSFQKTTKNTWQINVDNAEFVNISYEYYAWQYDAGGSVVDDNLLYINFINCIGYFEHLQQVGYKLLLPYTHDDKIATSLIYSIENNQVVLLAQNFHELTDSPIIISPNIALASYQVQNTTFNIWLYSEKNDVHPTLLIPKFKLFTKQQFAVFNEFPFQEYHFLVLLLPYFYYHGVEHQSSTVMVMGPSMDFHKPAFELEVLGLASHELYHAWNALSIRPKELSPFNFDNETYFNTGFVIEGVTTFMGDYLLAQSKVIDLQTYIAELNGILTKEIDQEGWKNLSLADASMELWLDGYTKGIQHRKVSIYQRGCLIAFITDILLKQKGASLNALMQEFWTHFGKTKISYTANDYFDLIEKLGNAEISQLISKLVFERVNLLPILDLLLPSIGLKLNTYEPNLLQSWGIKSIIQAGKTIVDQTTSHTLAGEQLCIGDEIFAINNYLVEANLEKHLLNKETVVFHIIRNKKILNIELKPNPDLAILNHEFVIENEGLFGKYVG